MNIVDIIIIAVMALSVYTGYRRGFIKSVYSILSLVATYILLFFFKTTLITAIANSPVGEAIGKLFVKEAGDTVITQQASSAVIYLASGIILYFAIKLVLGIVLKVLDALASLPVIKTLNKFLGLCIGIVIGLLWVIIALNVLYAIPQTTQDVSLSELASYFSRYIIF